MLESCPECAGTIETRPTADGVSEDVCLNCGTVVKTSRIETLLDRPLRRLLRRGYKRPRTMKELLDKVDPNWKYLVPRFFTAKDPNPILSSLFHNPFVGVWDYKDRTKPSRKSFNVGYDEVYCPDKRRTNKYEFHCYVRILLERSFRHFARFASIDQRRRKGLLAACLYVEAMLQIFSDVRVFNWSKKPRHYVRTKSVWPKPYEKWASCIHLSEKTIMKRVAEIEEETPSIFEKIAFLRRF